MRKLSLKRGLRQAKVAYWVAEEKFAKLLVRVSFMPISDKRWKRLNERKEMARLEMNECQQERDIAQQELNMYNRKEEKRLKKTV
jgi:hypothetical protein